MSIGTIELADPLERIKRRREQKADSQAKIHRTGNELGALPPRKRVRLWNSCRRDLHRFLVKCFPRSTGKKPFSEEQLRAILNIQTTIFDGGNICNVLPRGFAKTTIATRAACWAVAYGHCRYVVIYAANKTLSEEILAGAKMELQTNPILFEMFPDICFPIRALENNAIRCRKQTYAGAYTHIAWKADGITFPTIPDSEGSGGTIEVKAMNAARGAHKVTSEGDVLRPDFMLFDDPQTDEDAENTNTVGKICKRIQTALMGGGHFDPTSAVMNITVIEDDDVAIQHLNNENWVSVRFKMMESLPSDFEKEGGLWTEYFGVRRAFTKDDAESRKRALTAANKFYRKNRKAMDLDAKPTWKDCFKSNEISATQHALNIICDNGMYTFVHECQNQTSEDEEKKGRFDIHWRDVIAKTVPRPVDVCPDDTIVLTGHIDVHETVLCYCLIAWTETFAGHVVRKGVWPEQSQKNFIFRKARKQIPDVAPAGADMDGAIYAALVGLIDEVMYRDYVTESGQPVKIDGLGIDANFRGGPVTDVINNHPAGGILFPMKGRGVKVKDRKISEWKIPKGSKRGEEWMYGRSAVRELKQFVFDANYWKCKAAEAIRAALGSSFCLTIHAGNVTDNRMFANHQAAENPISVSVDIGGIIKHGIEWKLPPAAPDNHGWDNLVGAMVLASYRGVQRSVPAVAGGRKGKLRRRVKTL